MKLMEELFTCPICKLSFGHKARLRKHIKSIRNPLKRISLRPTQPKRLSMKRCLFRRGLQGQVALLK
jgi:hypothetical protein